MPETEKKDSGFVPANELKPSEYSARYTQKVEWAAKLLDHAAMRVRENLPAEFGICVTVRIDDVLLTASTVPPARISGGGGGYGGRPQAKAAVFDKAQVEAILMANMDALKLETLEGKMVIKPSKYLGDLWAIINDDMKKAGMTWISDAKNSRWVQP